MSRTVDSSGGSWKRAKTSENASRAEPWTSNCSGTYSILPSGSTLSSFTWTFPLGSYTYNEYLLSKRKVATHTGVGVGVGVDCCWAFFCLAFSRLSWFLDLSCFPVGFFPLTAGWTIVWATINRVRIEDVEGKSEAEQTKGRGQNLPLFEDLSTIKYLFNLVFEVQMWMGRWFGSSLSEGINNIIAIKLGSEKVVGTPNLIWTQ